MWRAYIESDSGEILRILRPDGSFGGKALLTFLTTVTRYLQRDAQTSDNLTDEIAWFNSLEQHTKKPLANILSPLEHCYYAGDWSDYALDEWEFFIRRNKIDINQWQFEQALASIHEKWTLISRVHKSLTYLLPLLQSESVLATPWYYPDVTGGELSGLEQALQVLKARHSKLVRIKFL